MATGGLKGQFSQALIAKSYVLNLWLLPPGKQAMCTSWRRAPWLEVVGTLRMRDEDAAMGPPEIANFNCERSSVPMKSVTDSTQLNQARAATARDVGDN